jgi:FkbM family methyltransferase
MKIKSNLRSVIRHGFAALMLNRTTVSLYNQIFERSPHWLANILVRLHTRPNFDFIWTTSLLNGHTIRVPVRANNLRSWEFAHAYHWHDIGIRNLEYALLSKHCGNGNEVIFLDIGANMGVRSLVPLSMGIRSVLFEPNRTLRQFSEELFQFNQLQNYEIVNVCLSNFEGSARFYVSSNSYLSSLDRAWLPDGEMATEINVAVRTLDDWLSGRPDISQQAAIVKIDVEGAEFSVLSGGRRFIAERRPQIIVEVAPDNRKRIFEFCKEIDYRIFQIREADHLALDALNQNQFLGNLAATNFFMTAAERELPN